MKMKIFLSIFFFVVSCGLSVGIVKEFSYHHNITHVTWNKAQWYCRKYYRDLATVNSATEHRTLVNNGYLYFSTWIGLHRTDVAKNIWMWSDNEAVSFKNWKTGPLADQEKNCTAVYDGFWFNDPCDSLHPFSCYRYLILVNEAKTWDDALQYCISKYTSLASMPNTQLQQAKVELALTETVSVWTGLRFMGGQWFWLNGEPLEKMVSNMPTCPPRPYHCGAFNFKTNVWENRDCNDKLNFLCWN